MIRVFLVLLSFWSGGFLPCYGQARMWEEEITIPTWEVGPAESHPTFEWSSERPRVYPYPYKEILTNRKADKTYKAIWLENEFIRVLVLPEIGGRLHGARDKTKDYNFFYWQPTIKPALVGMTGAWISGGIEWNFPHGHRPTAFSPVGYRLVEGKDGSKTVWVGETERIFGMRWIVGLTVYPGKSLIEAKVRLVNPTPLRHSFQMWTTTAVNANENYQAIYPTRLMTGHGKTEYYNWPVDEGKDISWWKNIPNPSSFFAVEPGNFFGGYDHGRESGTVITGDPEIVIGKKLWTWGTSPLGRIWEPILTEGEGPYFEPQAGAYSDNQPDYHWLQPGERRSYSHYFFPVRDIGGFKAANKHGAANLERNGDRIQLGVYSTAILPRARVRLTSNGTVLYHEEVALDPSRPLVQSLAIEGEVHSSPHDRLELFNGMGKLLLVYESSTPEPQVKPEPLEPAPDPVNLETTDELWHAGERIYRFRDPTRARAYFEEVLKRDPLDSRTHITLAELEIKQAQYLRAMRHLELAEERDSENGKIHYLKGLAEYRLGNFEKATRHYSRAAHFEDFFAQAHEQLGRLALRHDNFQEALHHLDQSLSRNLNRSELQGLRAATLRLGGRKDESGNAAEIALELDPLNAMALYEFSLANPSTPTVADPHVQAELQKVLLDDQEVIQLALHYADSGLFEDSLKVLDDLSKIHDFSGLIHYYRGYFQSRAGYPEQARQSFRKGSQISVDGVFPFRSFGLEVFREALAYQPDDDKAHYYLGLIHAGLGNVGQAVTHWERAVDLQPANAHAWRNLGLALSQKKHDLNQALEAYEKAEALAPQDSRILMELDQVREELGFSDRQRLAFLKGRLQTVQSRDDLLTEMLDLMVRLGEFREALDYYLNHHFHNWEGRYQIHNAYMEAYMALADEADAPQESLKYLQAASEYPLNLEVAPREPNLRGFLYLPMSRAHRQLGNAEEAERLLEITANEETSPPTLATYYRALALHDLGEISKAEEALLSLEKEALDLVAGSAAGYQDYDEQFTQALGHYYKHKILLAKEKETAARQELSKALELESRIERRALILAQRIFANASQ